MQVYLHSFLTSALGGDGWSTSRPDRFTPRSEPQEAGWAPEPVRAFWGEETFFPLVGMEPRFLGQAAT